MAKAKFDRSKPHVNVGTLTYSRVRELPLSVTVHRVTLMHSTLRRAVLT